MRGTADEGRYSEAVISAAGARPMVGEPLPKGASDVRRDVSTSMP